MVVKGKIEHVDKLPNGVMRFRRRFPKDVGEFTGQRYLQVHIRNTSGVAFAREYQAIIDNFDKIVIQARAEMGQTGVDTRTTQEKWHDALLTAAGLKEGIVGLDPDDPETVRMILEGLPKKVEPMVKKAMLAPDAPAPKVTLGDAFKLYAQHKEIAKDRKKSADLKRLDRRVREAFGDIDKLSLEDLNSEHRRKYRDYFINAKQRNGDHLSPTSMGRETNIMVALLNHAEKETDVIIKRGVFSGIEWPKMNEAEVDKRLPLPDDLVDAVSYSLKADARHPELQFVWALLVSTGARVSEFAALLREDVKLNDAVPHILIRPNAAKAGRKTKTSVRSLPLTKRSQEALKEALKLSEGKEAVFPRYATTSGNTNLSGAIMKHVHKFNDGNRKLTTHGLRHRVSDKMRDVGAPVEVRKGYLGHAMQEVAENTYGGREARLREFVKWAEKADL